jgi:glucosamine--fructose-6-phosphate aminotransferase (isomerizing)
MSKMMTFIEEQPAAFRRLLDQPLDISGFAASMRAQAVTKVWMLGSGTSLYAAMIAAEYWEARLGIDCEAISSLEFSNSTAASRPRPSTCVVAISQSGATFVLVEAIKNARALGCLTLGVTAEPDSLLAHAAEHIVLTHTGPEDALGKTKGFSTTTFAACLIGLLLDGSAKRLAVAQDVPDALSGLVHAVTDVVSGWVERLADAGALFVIGAGQQLPAAWEGGLKVLEVAKQVVVTKELEEMLHGPFNGVGPDSGFILLAGRVNRPDRIAAFINGVQAVGRPLLSIAEPGVASPSAALTWDMTLPVLTDPGFLPILGVVPLQILAERLAVQRGLDPDTARYPFLYKILAAKSIYV